MVENNPEVCINSIITWHLSLFISECFGSGFINIAKLSSWSVDNAGDPQVVGSFC